MSTNVGWNFKGGKLRALAVTSSRRLPVLPDVPTVAESGHTGFGAVEWKVLVGPAKLAQEMTRHRHGADEKTMGKPEAMARLLSEGSAPMNGSPEELGAFLKAELERWSGVVRDAAVKRD